MKLELRQNSLYDLWNRKYPKLHTIPGEIPYHCNLDRLDQALHFLRPSGQKVTEENEIIDRTPNDPEIDLRRGDLVEFENSDCYRNDGLCIFNGKEIVELDFTPDDYGNLPKEFKAIDEFPLKYFHLNGPLKQRSITHNYNVWFDHKQYLDQILQNIKFDNQIYPVLLDHESFTYYGPIAYTYFKHKNGRRYYIAASGENFYWNGESYDYHDRHFPARSDDEILRSFKDKLLEDDICFGCSDESSCTDDENWIKGIEILFIGNC